MLGLKLGRCLWRQDESSLKSSDEETIGVEWQKRFNQEFDEDEALDVHDIKCPLGGEAIAFEMPNEYLAVVSFAGWAIYSKNGEA